MKVCPICGASLEDNAMFCTYCGTSVSAVAPKPVAAPTAPAKPAVQPAPAKPAVQPTPAKPAAQPAPAPAVPVKETVAPATPKKTAPPKAAPATKPAPAKPAPAKPAPAKAAAAKTPAAKPKAPEVARCPKCGLPRSQSKQFCIGCGTPLDSNVVSQISATPPTSGTSGFLRFLCFAVAIIFVIVFMARRLDKQANTIPVITITVQLNPDGSEETTQWLTSMEQEFAARYPEYQIIWNHEIVSMDQTYAFMMEDASSAADIYLYDSSNLETLANQGALLPLENHISDEYSPTVNNAITYSGDGQVYGYPISQNTWCLYYNNEVFNEQDVTSLEAMLAEGRVTLPMLESEAAGCFFLGAGCTIFGETGKDVSAGFDFNNDGAFAVAKKLPGLVLHSNVRLSKLVCDDLLEGYSDAAFAPTADYAEAQAVLGDKLGVAVLPSFSVNNESYQMTALSSVICVGVNPNCGDDTKKELCTGFASFISSADAQIARYKADGTIPATLLALSDSGSIDSAIVNASINTMSTASVLKLNNYAMDNYYVAMNEYITGIVDRNITANNYRGSLEALHQQLNA